MLGMRTRTLLGLLVSALGASACAEGPTSLAPEAAPGFVTVHTVASGRWIPEGGLQVWVDQDPAMVYQLRLNGSAGLTLPPGDHTIELFRGRGQPFYPACGVEGGLARDVTVESGKSVLVEYELYCEVSLELTASTGGFNPDPDGYRFLVGPPFVGDEDFGFPVYDLPIGSSLVFDRQSPYWWDERWPTYVYVWGLEDNCTLLAPNPLIIQVGGGLRQEELVSDCVDAPPSTGTIYFLGSDTVFRINADGTGLSQITTGSSIRNWVLSPDGSEIMYSPWGDGGLFRVGIDGSGLNRIAPDDEFYDTVTHWGVDGRILFESFVPETDGPEVFSILPDGSDRQRLTAGGGRTASLSPDGTRIVFDGPQGLSMMNPDGSGIVAVGSNLEALDPKWSPDGSALVALVSDGSRWQVTRVDPGTGAFEHLTSLVLQFFPDFAWSPDGSSVVYTARPAAPDFPVDYSAGEDLYTVSGTGSRLARLTNLGLEMSQLDWRE